MSAPDTPQSERRSRDAESAAVAVPTPRLSWTGIVVGLGVCVAAAVLAVVLAQQYVKSRPLNLREQTAVLSDAIEQALVNCRVPKASIVRGEPQLHADAEASWVGMTFDVDLPETMDGSALIKLVARRMQPFNVVLIESAFENSIRKAAASLGEREFVTLNIREKPPKTDLTELCGRMVRNMNTWIESQGVSADAIEVVPPVRKDDAESIWQYVRMSAPSPTHLALDAIEDRVRETAEQSVETDKERAGDVRVSANIGTRGTTTFAVSLGTRTCIELVLTRTDLEPSPEDLAAGSLPALHASSGQELSEVGIPDIEDLPLDSAGLEDMDLGRKLSGVSTPPLAIPHVAIIVDDGGYGGPATNSILALDPNLTLAILPNTPFAGRTAKRAEELGFEVLLHLPMECPEVPGQFTTGMSENEMRQRLDDDLAQVPGAAGINNHMGSVFTSDADAVDRFMKCLTGRGLFFIDSRTAAHSKAFDIALKNTIPAGMRDVFLDNKKDKNYIIGQFNHLMDVAKERGQAIGICHFRALTAQVLVTMLPQLEKNGIKLVHASELVQNPAVAAPLTAPIPVPQEKTGNTTSIPAEPRH